MRLVASVVYSVPALELRAAVVGAERSTSPSGAGKDRKESTFSLQLFRAVGRTACAGPSLIDVSASNAPLRSVPNRSSAATMAAEEGMNRWQRRAEAKRMLYAARYVVLCSCGG